MTKAVLPNSFEHALRRVLLILGEAGAEEAILRGTGVRRSASLLRKCADADDQRHQIQLRYASALDMACVAKGHLPPLLEAQKRLVAAYLADGRDGVADAADLSRSLLDLQATLGGLAAILRASAAPEGGPLREVDRLAIFRALETLIEQAGALERRVCPPTLDQRRPAPQPRRLRPR